MNSSKKIIFIAVGGILALLFIFAAVMLFRGIRQFGVAEQNLAATRTQLNSFYAKKPFPSPENIKSAQEDVKAMEGWMRDIIDIAKKSQIEPDPRKSPSVFVNLLAQVSNELREKASKQNVELEKEFAFGFDRYAQGNPATADYVPRLIQQLMIIDSICSTLIDAKVIELHSIEREEFDAGTVQARQPRPRTPARPRNTRTTQRPAVTAGMRPAATIPQTPPDESTGKFVADESFDAKLKFVFEFTAKEASVIKVLNNLARSEMFVVVSSVEIEGVEPTQTRDTANTARDTALARPGSNSAIAALFGGSKPAVAGGGTKPASARIPSREERVEWGGKKEHPVKVRIEVEVYRFK